jgi:preprotein translocase subunit SecG
MIYGLVMVVHILVALFLIGVVLLQGGRGGLGEALGGAGAQSLFGGSANVVMAKLTTVVGALFMITCLSLAALSTARGRSVIQELPAGLPSGQVPLTLPTGEVPTLPTPVDASAPSAAPTEAP